MALVYIIVIILASVILVKSAHWVIKTLTYLAQYLRIPEFVVAFILGGIATSLPELFVGISSAFVQKSILSLSDVLGSNIANLTIILGLPLILIRGLKSKIKKIQYNIIYNAILLVYPILLALDKEISRIDGLGLLVAFILYNIILFYQSKDFTKKLERVNKKDLTKNIIFFLLSITLLLISAKFIVYASTLLAIKLNIPLFIIGLFLIAVGTSLPELVFGIKAAVEKHKDMILGNILGSLATNSTAVLGITAIISPIIIQHTNLFFSSASFLLITYFIFIIFTKTKNKISWQESLVLLFLYIAFIIVQFLIK